MRDAFACDISDYLKFALLRRLSGTEKVLGMAWYYVDEPQKGNDGGHREWMEDLNWRVLDPDLFDVLTKVPERSVAALEQAKIWPENTAFHRICVPRRPLRDQWATQMRKKLETANLVFLDPDNGLGLHPKNHATFDEVCRFRGDSRILVSIKFPAMVNYKTQVRDLHDRLKLETGTKQGFTVTTNVAVPRKTDPRYFVQRPRWFSVIDSDTTALDRARQYAHVLSTIPRARAGIVTFGFEEQ